MSVPLLALATVAALMAAATAYLLALAVEARRRPQLWIAAYLLAMMGEMWVGAVLYLRDPSTAGLVAALGVSGALMIVSVVPLLLALVQTRAPAGASRAPPEAPLRLGVPAALGLAGLVLAAEFGMSWALQLASGALAAGSGGVAGFAAVVNSPWFLFTMSGEMVLTTLLLWARIPRALGGLLLAQAGIMLFSPPALGGATWPALAIYVSSALMIGVFVFLFEYLYRYRQLSEALSTYLVELTAVYGLMMAGLFAWQYFGDGTTFAIAVVLEMLVVYGALARPAPFHDGPSTPWQLRPAWATALLSGVFVAELGMGAVLSVQLDPSDYLGGFPFLAVTGTAAGTALLNALQNGFWFFAIAAGSTWFLIMMGLEMGALVVFKFRETKNLENRVRLALMMGSYAGFAVFFPSIYFGMLFPNAPDPSTVPVLGWSMGIGSYPLAVGVFGVLLLTYVITGVLVVLFGRRVICSVFCTAPMMYQGTTLDAMKSFNRSSPIARKYLSSRFSAAYSVTLGLVLVGLLATSVLSYLDSIGAASVYVLGTDPSVFFFIASFSVAWYVLFVAIPYAGNYNCVTLGWCYTGTIAQAFQKIGSFKLKVRDPQVCRDCTTLDCAQGCPVGLVDMPGHFRRTGEFRSTKCCGVGDCVEDCPYDNLYISDVRHSVRRLLGRPETRPRRGPAPAARGSAGFPGPGLAAATYAPEPDAVLLPMVGGPVPAPARARPARGGAAGSS